MSGAFNGTSSDLRFAGLNLSGAFTIRAKVKLLAADGAFQALCGAHSSAFDAGGAGAGQTGVGRRSNNYAEAFNGGFLSDSGGDTGTPFTWTDDDAWVDITWRRSTATGNITYDKSIHGSGVGTRVMNSAGSAGGANSTTGHFRVGNWEGDGWFNGRLAALAVKDGTALSDADIDALDDATSSAQWASIMGLTTSDLLIDASDLFATNLLTGSARLSGANVSSNGDDPSSFTYGLGDTAPDNTTPAAITGTPQVGQTLTTTTGTWDGDPAPTVTRKWQRSDNGTTGWSDIASATSTTYVVQNADEAKYLRVLESAMNTVSTVTQASNVVGPVAAAPALAFSVRQSGGASNTDLTASHGGTKSSAQVTLDPGVMGLSTGDANTRLARYWCFYLHNAEASRSFTAKAWFSEQPDGGNAWKVGAGVAAAGSTETATADTFTAPSGVTLASPSSEGAATALGTVAPGQGKAFWVMRPADAALEAGEIAMELHIKLDEVV